MTTNLVILDATACGSFVLPLVIIGILGLGIAFIALTSPFRRRRGIKITFQDLKLQYLDLNETYNDKLKNGFYGNNFPSWAVQEVQKTSAKFLDYKKTFTPDQAFFDAFLLEKDINTMQELSQQLSDYLRLLKSFLSSFEKIEAEIKRVEYTIQQTVNHIQERLDTLNASLLKHMEEGYTLQKANAEYVLLKIEFAQVKILRKSKPSGDKEIESLLKDLFERTGYLEKDLYDLVQYRAKTDDLVSHLHDRYLALPLKKEAADSALTFLKNFYPASCWTTPANNFNQYHSLLREYMDFMKLAQEQNSMDVQNFELAYKIVQTAEEKLQLVERFVADIHDCKANLEKSKRRFFHVFKAAEQSVQLAKAAIGSSDEVNNKILVEAQEKLIVIRSQALLPHADWVTMENTLREIKDFANQFVVKTTN